MKAPADLPGGEPGSSDFPVLDPEAAATFLSFLDPARSLLVELS